MFLSLEILFKGVIFISNRCSIWNNMKAPAELQLSVKNEAIKPFIDESQCIDIVIILSLHPHQIRWVMERNLNTVTSISERDRANSEHFIEGKVAGHDYTAWVFTRKELCTFCC